MFEYWKQSWLVLTLAVVLGGTLAALDRALQPRIDRHAEQQLRRAVLQVVPEGRDFEPLVRDGLTLYRVKGAGGNLRGWAVPAEGLGFADRIAVMIGLSSDATRILGLVVLQSKETPGLGDKIREEAFREQFVANATLGTLQLVKPGEIADQPIHAITGATISSRAVTAMVNLTVVAAREAIRGETAGQAQDGPRGGTQ